ncbi:metallophosphoesterase [Glycomyces sp. TRM65418]|uniref:metallophosphoesterase family protein n=1 Tax=Glycomyces sp. TRM65418 TaxID=2867006 RepID=UPI001CE7149D|nr:metallophosphoesterase [Glycomyces sp. TRM65418]MCC3765417.1 metallophosphoesterase [Glycomyces sp. TRM65418]QZD55028.1 metallophosphoesterase [Glycomyces sp. TRM65418]
MNDRLAAALHRFGNAARPAGRRAKRLWRTTKVGWFRLRRSPATRRVMVVAAILFVGTAAAAGGLALVGGTKADIGPFDTTVALHPDLTGETVVQIPPLGDVVFDSHDGPLGVNLKLDSVDPVEAQAIINTPGGVTSASESLASDVTDAVVRVVVEALAIVTLCGLLVGALAFRTMRRALLTGLTALSVTAALMGYAASTLRAESISQPRYEGLLAYAPSVVGNAEEIAVNYEEYVANLQKFVTNISEFYSLAMDMPQLGIQDDSIRVLHVSDIHLNPSAWHLMESVVQQFDIDAVADTGDMNDWGSEQEAEIFSQGVEQIEVPYVFVKGNHDSATTVAALAAYEHVIILDGEVQEVAGLNFAGVPDPRFTPDKGSEPSSEYTKQMLTESGERLARAIENAGGADLAMVHEPPMAEPLAGVVPLVLSGHTHKRSVKDLGEGTTLMVEGSTGAAGLRHFETEDPMKMEMDVLYFDPVTKALTAYDSISVGSGSETDVTLDRTVIPAEERVGEGETPISTEETATQDVPNGTEETTTQDVPNVAEETTTQDVPNVAEETATQPD